VIKFCSSLSNAATATTLTGMRSSARNETVKKVSVESAITAAHWMDFFIYPSIGKILPERSLNQYSCCDSGCLCAARAAIKD
jgi:hypothetical protein